VAFHKKTPERVLVTGGGGFLGKAVVKKLLSRGDRVTAFSRKYYPELETLGIRQIQGDIADEGAVRQAIHNQDVVFHIAALPGVWGDYDDFYRINTKGTLNVIAACVDHGISRLIYTSSPSVVFDGKDMEGVDESVPYPPHFEAAYPETKALAEKAVRALGENKKGNTATISLRPHLIWGPGDNHLVPRILSRARRLRRVGTGENRVDTIYIDNAADAHLLAADRLAERPDLSGKVYFISQGAPIRLWEMVDRILAAGNKPPVTKTISPKAAYRLGAMMEWVYRWTRIPGEPPMTRFMARELATSHWFDIGGAVRDLGYKPNLSTDEGLIRLEESLR
jgi:2-alkyl-3-oxoalkanoate reductase